MQSWQKCWCVLTSTTFRCSRDRQTTSINADNSGNSGLLLDLALTTSTAVQPLHAANDNSFAFRLFVSGGH